MKVTLRDLLWLILVTAVALSWFHSNRKQDAELRATIDTHNKVVASWKAETAEIIERYQKALDSVGYEKGLAGPSQELSQAQIQWRIQESRAERLLYHLRE